MDTMIGFIYLLILLFLAIGWILNLVKIFRYLMKNRRIADTPVMLIVRILAAFTFIPAGILGWMNFRNET